MSKPETAGITTATITALVRSASALSAEVAALLRAENGAGAVALAAILADDAQAEIIASVRLRPDMHIVLAITTRGEQRIIFDAPVAETPGARH